MPKSIENKSLKYHSEGKPGKIALKTTKPCKTQLDLSLAYTPGVAAPCLAIKNNPEDVWKYTARGNLVAVVSDGTAVLGLGNIGPEAGMPVMEGKAVLFKHFADIDTIPICLSKVFDKKKPKRKINHETQECNKNTNPRSTIFLHGLCQSISCFFVHNRRSRINDY